MKGEGLVKIKNKELLMFAFVISLLIVSVGLGNFFYRTTNIWIYLSFLIRLGVLILPLFIIKKKSFFHPLIFLSLYTLFFGTLSSINEYIYGMEGHSLLAGSRTELNYLVAYKLLLESFSFLFIYIGYSLFPNLKVPKICFPSPKKTFLKTFILFIVPVSSLIYLAQIAGGLDVLFMQRGMHRSERIISILGGHWVLLVNLSIIVCYVLLSLKPWLYKKFFFWGLVVVSLGLKFVVTGSRSDLIIPIIIFLCIIIIYKQKVPYKLLIVLFIASVIIFGLSTNFRNAIQGSQDFSEINLNISIIENLEKGIESYSSHRSSLYPILAKVPEEEPLLYGKSYLSIPFIPIPSKILIWGGKPDAAGKLAGDVFYNVDYGIPTGTLGEAYWNFHLPGVVVIYIIWGCALKLLRLFYYVNHKEKAIIILYIITLLDFSPHSNALYNWAHKVVPVIAVLIFYCGFPKILVKSSSNKL